MTFAVPMATKVATKNRKVAIWGKFGTFDGNLHKAQTNTKDILTHDENYHNTHHILKGCFFCIRLC